MNTLLADGPVPTSAADRHDVGKAVPRLSTLVRAELARVRGPLVLAGLSIVGSTLAAVAAPWPIKWAFDRVLMPVPGAGGPGLLSEGSLASLAWLCLAMVAIAAVAGACGYAQQVITSRIGFQIVHALRSTLFDHVQGLSLSFHHRARSGELMSKIVVDTLTLRDVYTESLLVFVTHGLTLVGMLIVLLTIDLRLGLMSALTFPLLLLLLVRRLRRVTASARRQRSNEGRMAHRVGEMLQSISLVQAFGRGRTEHARFDAESRASIAESIRTARAEAGATRVVEITTVAGTAAVLMVGGALALGGALTAGELLVCMAYVTAMFRPVKNLSKLSARMAKARASMERIDEILAIRPHAVDAADAVDAPALTGDIRFEHVSVGYEGRTVLDDVSLHIPAGTRVAVVGASGSGKSTLLRLLVRLVEPSAGTVRIDGVDLRHWRRDSVRDQIGMVLQDNLLLGCSVRDNIAYGKAAATPAQVEAAARLAQAHDFVSALPDGYDHVLGPGGATLSGGQRQRLCLARALIKAPPILLLDEPTSAVDAEAERQIRVAVASAQRGRTSIVVAHQMQSVADADWIVVMRAGRIVEQGRHDELLARRGAYAELFLADAHDLRAA